MKILTDLHMHTVGTPEVYSTLNECVVFAKRQGLELIAITNHSPSCFNTQEDVFTNMVAFPREIDEVAIIRGIEADILSQHGDLDISERVSPFVEFVVASCHRFFHPSDEKEFKITYENVIKNSKVDVLGHMCRENHLSHLDYLIPLARENNKAIEINVFSFNRGVSEKWALNCKMLINKCLEHRTKICVNSDAHVCYSVGAFDEVTNYLKEIGFPEELVMNLNAKRVMQYIHNR